MDILFLTPIFPDTSSGGGMRTLNILKSLARHGAVTVICQSLNPAGQETEVASLRPHVREITVIETQTNRLYEKRARRPSVRTRLSSVMALEPWRIHDAFSRAFHEQVSACSPEQFDMIVARYDVAAQYVFKHPRASALMAKTVIDIDDVEPRILSRRISELPMGYPKFRYALEAWLTQRFYRQMRRVAACLVSSELDRRYVEAQGFAQRVFVVPNTVEVNGFQDSVVPRETAPTLLFCGTLDYRPNQDAVALFCEQIWPQILRAVPAARFVIVGQNPSERVRKLGALPGVAVAGSVASVTPYYQQAAVVVAPILNGGGTRIKILEAMAHGKPVVSTPVGCEGLGAVSGEHLAIADTPEAFAGACVQLLGSPQARATMARSAHAFVKEHYDVSALDRRLDEFIAWYRTR